MTEREERETERGRESDRERGRGERRLRGGNKRKRKGYKTGHCRDEEIINQLFIN